MSSWANRGIPRKRDLSQVPEEFRPTIVPRVEHPQVVLSETFQKETFNENEIIYPVDDWKASSFTGYSAKASVPSFPKPVNAKELIHNEKTYVFVLLRNIQKASDNELWLSAYHSIRQFYTNQIIIIDDNSSINTVNGKLVNTEIIQSEFNGAGELLPYYYFHKKQWADTMIFIHDSMVLYRPFTESELDHEVVFHWHFSNEKSNEQIIKKALSMLSSIGISTLDDYVQNGDWIGCFGGASIIDASVNNMLQEKYNLSKLTMYVRARKQRELVERILGILLSYEKKATSNFGDITAYPRPFESSTLKMSTYNIQQANYNTAILKLWRGR